MLKLFKISKKKNIQISIILSFFVMIISIVVNLFYTPFMLNCVGDKQYGIYNFIISILSWVTIAVNSLFTAYNKFAAEEISNDKEKGEEKINGLYTLIVLIWSIIILLISVIFYFLFSFNVIKLSSYNETERNLLTTLFLIILIQTLITILTKVFYLNIAFNNHHLWIKLGSLFTTIAPPLISIPFLLNGCSIISVCIIIVSCNVFIHILDFVFDRYVLKKRIKIILNKNVINLIKPIFFYCSIILINEIAFQIDASIDNLALGFKGMADEISLYSLSFYLINTAYTCISLFYTPLIPTVFKNESLDQSNKNLELFDIITFAQMLFWFLIFGGFLACGYYFTILWVGEKRIIVFYIAISLFCIRSMSACSGPAKDMMRAKNKHLQRALLAIGSASLNAIITITLINALDQKFAIWSCIIGTATSNILCWWIIGNILNWKYLKVNIKKYILRFLLLALFSVLCAFISNTIVFYAGLGNLSSLLIGGSIFVVVFGTLVFLFFKRDIKRLLHLLKI